MIGWFSGSSQSDPRTLGLVLVDPACKVRGCLAVSRSAGIGQSGGDHLFLNGPEPLSARNWIAAG